MWKYVNQRCWISDFERKCFVRGNRLTMILTGPPNPNYDPMKPLPIVTAPVATLADVLKYYPAAEFADHICSATSNIGNDGLTCLSIECKLTKESPKPDIVCENIAEYLNQCGWLGATKNKCSNKDDKLFLEISGK